MHLNYQSIHINHGLHTCHDLDVNTNTAMTLQKSTVMATSISMVRISSYIQRIAY